MTEAEYFSTGDPLEREVYEAVRAILEPFSPLIVEFVSVGIFFKRGNTFAELRPTRRAPPARRALVLFWRPLKHPRFARTRQGGQRSAGFLNIYDARDRRRGAGDCLPRPISGLTNNGAAYGLEPATSTLGTYVKSLFTTATRYPPECPPRVESRRQAPEAQARGQVPVPSPDYAAVHPLEL
jgi:hypothetical protein